MPESSKWQQLCDCAFNLHSAAFMRGDKDAMCCASKLFFRYKHKFAMALARERRHSKPVQPDTQPTSE